MVNFYLLRDATATLLQRPFFDQFNQGVAPRKLPCLSSGLSTEDKRVYLLAFIGTTDILHQIIIFL